MSATASKLDTEKFRKVHVMMTGGATPGERLAAKARAEVMAAKAGMSLKAAVSSLSARAKAAPAQPSPKPQPGNFFDGFDDWCEAREPGYKAKRAAEKAERDARDAVKRAEVLGQYGSEDALFDFTPNEKALREAVKPIAGWGHWTDNQGKRHYYAKTLDGIKPKHGFWSVEEITPTIRAAVQGAYPWPTTLRDAFAEVVAWDELRDARSLFTGIGDCDHHAEVECRIQLLQHDLAIGVPAASWDDVQTRFDWFGYRDKWGLVTSGEMMARLQADFNVLRDLSAPELGSANVAQPEGVSPELRPLPRTTAEKRAAILSMLDREPGLSSREIARRLGISPQTVSTWRKAK